MRVEPGSLDIRDRYSLLISVILPRPIAWVSTISPEGVTNLAPFSFFTGISAEPMSVLFCPVNTREGRRKDTLINVEKTRQFVVNMATEGNAAQMNRTSAAYPYGVSEFEKVGLTALPSAKVKPPRVKESPVALECELRQIVSLADGPLGGHVVIGTVVLAHVDDAAWNDGRPRHQDLKAIGRMEGAWYARTRDAFELSRPDVSVQNTPPEAV